MKEKLIFCDDFTKENATLENWNIVEAKKGNVNQEDQRYVNSNNNIRIEDHMLKIIGLKKEDGYTSAKIVSKQTFQYGRFEMVARIPHGSGSWPAFWMLPPTIKKFGWPKCGEIDIMENIGRNKDVIHFSLHTKDYNHVLRNQRTYFEKIDGAETSFKKYALIWTKNSMEFLVDDRSYVRFEKNDSLYSSNWDGWPFDQPFHMIVNLAIGGTWGGQIDDCCFPMEYAIKSIKVYKLGE